MKYFCVSVYDRISEEEVTVGYMLTAREAYELICVLEKYNSTDLLISKEDMK